MKKLGVKSFKNNIVDPVACEKIVEDKNRSNIIPIIMNTGDMTKNGKRINEWFDY